NLALAEVTDAKSRFTNANSQRDAGLRQRDIELREREADDRALSRNRNDVLRAIDVMRNSDTPQKWEQNSPYIQAVYGRQVGFNERPMVLAQAQNASRQPDAFEPTDEEAQLGITREMKMESARTQKLGGMFGKKGEQKEGYRYDIRDGQVVQIPTT